MAWGIGANDVANAMVRQWARALTLKQAILVGAIFEFTGAYLADGEVTSTIRKGIVDGTLTLIRQNYWYMACFLPCWRLGRQPSPA